MAPPLAAISAQACSCCNGLAAAVRPRANTVFPTIKSDLDRLLQTTPNRIAEKQEKQKVERKEKDKAKEAATAPQKKDKQNSSGEDHQRPRRGAVEGRAQECLCELGVDWAH